MKTYTWKQINQIELSDYDPYGIDNFTILPDHVIWCKHPLGFFMPYMDLTSIIAEVNNCIVAGRLSLTDESSFVSSSNGSWWTIGKADRDRGGFVPTGIRLLYMYPGIYTARIASTICLAINDIFWPNRSDTDNYKIELSSMKPL